MKNPKKEGYYWFRVNSRREPVRLERHDLQCAERWFVAVMDDECGQLVRDTDEFGPEIEEYKP